MERYGVYILASLIMIIFGIIQFKLLHPFLRRRGFTISKREIILLIVLGLFLLFAFIFTYIITEGTFVG